MTRWVSANNADVAGREIVGMCTMCDLDFASGMVRLSDCLTEIPWNGFAYTGLGSFGSVSVIEENMDGIARGVQATLWGPEELLAPAVNEIFQDRPATFYLGVFDEHSRLVDTPETIWAGRMDTMDIKLRGNESSITLNCEYRLRREPLVCRYTQADQHLRYPTDNFFQFLGLIAGARASWGEKQQSYGTGPILPSAPNFLYPTGPRR